MELKIMNVMGQQLEVSIDGDPVQIDVTVLSGDEIIEVFYLSHVEVFDISKMLGVKRSMDSFAGRHTVYIRNRFNIINNFNMRSNPLDKWWA